MIQKGANNRKSEGAKALISKGTNIGKYQSVMIMTHIYANFSTCGYWQLRNS